MTGLSALCRRGTASARAARGRLARVGQVSRRRGFALVSGGLALLLTGLALSLMVTPASASTTTTATTCGFGTGGPLASTLCWIDFRNYNDSTALSSGGQQYAMAISGGYSMSFTVNRVQQENVFGVDPVAFPTWRGAPIGNSEYKSTPGEPALYSQISTNHAAGVAALSTITLSNISITDSAGQPMTGWTLYEADAESTDIAGNTLSWTTNGGVYQLAESVPPLPGTSMPTCPENTPNLGIGTQTVTCDGSGTTAHNIGELIISTTSPTTASATLGQISAQQQAVAFGISVAQLSVAKSVAGRVSAGDQFNVSAADQNATQVGSATTTGSGTSATTGTLNVLPGSPYSLTESAAGTSTLSNYSESWSCSNSNSGSSTALPSGSTSVPVSVTPAPADDISCTLTNTPWLTLVKSASPSSFSAAGQVIAYSFAVTNNGNGTLSSVGITDGMTGLSAVSCPQPSLAAGASETCTAAYTVTQADVDAGSVSNTATAQGLPPGAVTPAVSGPSTATVPAVQSPGISVVKSASPASFSAAGQAISYSFAVTNTGNVTLTSVGITDPLPGLSVITCPTSTLAVGAQETCRAIYVITQQDVAAGTVTNTAVAHGDPPGSITRVQSGESTVTVQAPAPIVPTPVPVTG